MLYLKRKARGFILCTGVEEAAAVGAAGAGTAGAGTAAAGGLTLASAAPYIAAATTLAGMYAQNQAQQEAAQRQSALLQKNAEVDAQYQKKNTDLSTEEAQQYDPTTRALNQAAAEDAASNSLTNSLVDARENQAAPAATSGKVSNDFTTGQAKTAAGELQRSTNIAKLMAAVRGPTDLRANEAINNASYADQIGANAGNRSAAAQAGMNDVSMVHPDGTQMLLGAGTQSLGTAVLANGLVKKAKTASATPTAAASVPGTEWYANQ